MDKIFNIASLIVFLAMIATLVGSKNTAGDVTAVGSVFTNALKAATGR